MRDTSNHYFYLLHCIVDIKLVQFYYDIDTMVYHMILNFIFSTKSSNSEQKFN